jgi:hypothetical protein
MWQDRRDDDGAQASGGSMTSNAIPATARRMALLLGMMIPLTLWAGSVQVRKEVALPLSPAETWKLVGDFCPQRQWSSDVLKCEIVSGANNRIGTVRQLSLRNGSTAREKLVAHDPKTHAFSYTIVQSDLPVTGYRSTLSVKPGPNGGSLVEWKSSFDAKPGADAAAAKKIVEGIYDTGLGSLQSATSAQH